MARPILFEIKESDNELRRLLHTSGPVFTKRLMAMRMFKAHEPTGISKRKVAQALGMDHGQVGKWRNMYIEGGMGGLLTHNKVGNRSSEIVPNHDSLKAKLEDPDNGIQGFGELLEWFNTEHGTSVNYKTLNIYVKRNFGASVKTARKSHVKKDSGKVAAFKKTSNPTVES